MTNRLLSLSLVALALGCSTTGPIASYRAEQEAAQFSFSWQTRPAQRVTPADHANILNLLESEKPMLALYREDVTHQAVVDFFANLTGSPETALPMMYYAERAGISFSLVFALAWTESRFSPVAVNRNATSVDRGLFQLNSLTFRDLTDDDFFHIDVNTYHGIDYLTWCLKHTEDEYQAVAVYNAGLTRVRAGRTPASTLVYVERIRQYRSQLERRFNNYILSEFPSHNA